MLDEYKVMVANVLTFFKNIIIKKALHSILGTLR